MTKRDEWSVVVAAYIGTVAGFCLAAVACLFGGPDLIFFTAKWTIVVTIILWPAFALIRRSNRRRQRKTPATLAPKVYEEVGIPVDRYSDPDRYDRSPRTGTITTGMRPKIVWTGNI